MVTDGLWCPPGVIYGRELGQQAGDGEDLMHFSIMSSRMLGPTGLSGVADGFPGEMNGLLPCGSHH